MIGIFSWLGLAFKAMGQGNTSTAEVDPSYTSQQYFLTPRPFFNQEDTDLMDPDAYLDLQQVCCVLAKVDGHHYLAAKYTNLGGHQKVTIEANWISDSVLEQLRPQDREGEQQKKIPEEHLDRDNTIVAPYSLSRYDIGSELFMKPLPHPPEYLRDFEVLLRDELTGEVIDRFIGYLNEEALNTPTTHHSEEAGVEHDEAIHAEGVLTKTEAHEEQSVDSDESLIYISVASAGIIGGVTVGVGVFFFMKRRREKEEQDVLSSFEQPEMDMTSDLCRTLHIDVVE